MRKMIQKSNFLELEYYFSYRLGLGAVDKSEFGYFMYYLKRDWRQTLIKRGIQNYLNIQRVSRKNMSNLALELVPPIHRGLTTLDRSLFTKEFRFCCVFFPDAKNISAFMKNNKNDIMSYPRVRFIEEINKTTEKNPKGKVIVLKDELRNIDDAESVLSPGSLEDIKKYNGEIMPYDMKLDYSFWKVEEILKAVLPENLLDEVPTSYTLTGHIAHLNLRDQYKPYDRLIGEVIMDKTGSITTVVDKVDGIKTQFRTFKMKVIAGKEDFIVSQRESNCLFKFDFSKVYWNSRLSTEHGRLVDSFKKGDAICDVMAGVGPFAVPAGKKKLVVFANDLNPESYKYLVSNIELNKVQKFVKSYNEDGREFIKNSPKLLQEYANTEKEIKISTHSKKIKVDDNQKSSNTSAKLANTETIEIPTFFSQYVMNLPDSAIQFIDGFVGIFTNGFPTLTKEEIKQLPGYRLPLVHFHHFEKFAADESPAPSMEELHKRIHQKMVKILGHPIDFDILSFHVVRMVAPTKPMFCVSFQVPENVAFAKE